MNSRGTSYAVSNVFLQLASLRASRVAQNTLRASAWNMMRIVLQGLSLILLARVLGAAGYGMLAGAVALFVTVAQFTGLGCGTFLVRHLSRGGPLQPALGTTQRAFAISGIAMLGLGIGLGMLVLPRGMDIRTMAFLAVAEILVAPLLLPLVYRFQAEQRLLLSGALLTLAPIARFVAVLVALIAGIDDIERFALIYAAALAISTAAALAYYRPGFRQHDARWTVVTTLRAGFPYAVSGAVNTAGSELDKTVLLGVAGGVVAGQYAAAYRIVQAATLPVNSLVLAVTPGQFARSGASRKEVGKLLAVTGGYALAAAIAIWIAAPVVPWLLGKGFGDTDRLLRLLCVAVVTNSLRQIVAMLLTTRDMQTTRNTLETVMVVFSIGMMLWLVPIMLTTGAVLALVASDICIIVLGLIALSRRPVSVARGEPR